MSESQLLSVIRVWAAVAWADGRIAKAEADALRKLIDVAGLGDDERATALGWLDSKVELDTSNVADLTDEARAGIYRAAARLVAVDLDVAAEETAFLGKLRQGLGLDEITARAIENEIPGLRRG